VISAPVPLSVVIAVRNGAAYLAESLRSVLNQDGPPFEVVVVDDGSTDATPTILAELSHGDARLRIVTQETQGFTRALSQAIRHASGELLARHDADDLSLPGRFGRQYDLMRAHPRLAAVGTAADVIDEGGSPVGRLPASHGPDAVRRGLRTLRATPVHGSMMIRREALEAIGGYRDALPAAQDYDLWLRLSERFDLDNVPEVLYRWRISPGGVYGRRRAEQLQYAGIALAFAWERERFGHDSYPLLEECQGNLGEFASRYQLAGPLEGLWGELLYRGLNNPGLARTHLWRAARAGSFAPKTIGLLAWSVLRLPWPGGRTLTAAPSPEMTRTSDGKS
jgi:glycosyltransferase involved in cell wall biosynthesis